MVICTVKPLAVAVGLPNAGVNAAPTAKVTVTVAEPLAYPVLVVVIVTVKLVPGAPPVTVTKPVPLTTTEPDAVAVPVHE